MSGYRVIGVDLSLTCSAVAFKSRTAKVARPSGQLHSWPELRRLRWMRDAVLFHVNAGGRLIDPTEPFVVIEGLAYTRTTGHATSRAGLWWLTVDALDQAGIAYAVVTPTCRARYATGRGNAGKDDVIREITKRFGWFDGGNDEADALALAAMGADHLGEPWVDMPKANRAALDAVEWPQLPAVEAMDR
jgi:crossover junction endodeoxyribonuclease RuvC